MFKQAVTTRTVCLLNSSFNLSRCASSKSATDPIQKLFLDKIEEYNKKSKTAPGGLVDADAKVQASIKDELKRIQNNFGIKDNEEDKITSKFSDADFKVDPIDMKEWK